MSTPHSLAAVNQDGEDKPAPSPWLGFLAAPAWLIPRDAEQKSSLDLGGLLSMIPSAPIVQFSSRAGRPVEPEVSTTKDVENGQQEYDDESQEDSEASEDEDEHSPTCSSAHSKSTKNGDDNNENAEDGAEIIPEHEVEMEIQGKDPQNYRQRPRSCEKRSLPKSVEISFEMLRKELWGIHEQDVKKSKRAGLRKEWQTKYKEATSHMYDVQSRRNNSFCSTEVINGLLIPLICLSLFILHIVMSTILFPKEREQ